MTLSPTTSVRGVEGPRAERNQICAVPGCISRAQHGHHIWSRSHLRGEPYEWVRLPDGRVVSNVIGLCVRHHEWVTGLIGGHKARIEYIAGSFFWHDLLHPENDGLLHPQPADIDPSTIDRGAEKMHPHRMLAEGESCPECGYMKPRRATGGPKRKTKTWGVTVPDDAEQGAEILDGLVEDFAAVLGLEPTSPRLLRYHVLVPVLFWASQHLPQLIADLREAAGSNGRHP